MNVFYLDPNPINCAQMHCDSHVVKMILETAQMLSTVCRMNCDYRKGLYAATHEHHPCVQWANLTGGNYNWLWRLGVQLCNEYTYRYGRIHKSSRIIHLCRYEPDNLKQSLGSRTPAAQVMPEQFMQADPVEAYRAYYRGEKQALLKYTRRMPPEWLQDLAVFKQAA